MSLTDLKKMARSLRVSIDAVNCYLALDGRPAYSDELVARGLCQGDRFTVLQACQELSKRNLIDRSEEHDGRWIRTAA